MHLEMRGRDGGVEQQVTRVRACVCLFVCLFTER